MENQKHSKFLPEYTIEERKNYGGTVLFNGKKVSYYTVKQMKSLYPSRNYKVLFECTSKSRAKVQGLLAAGGDKFPLSAVGSHNRLLYRVKGYAAIGEDSYVAILQNVIALRIALLVAALAVIAASVILVVGSQPQNTIPTGGKDLELEEGAVDWEGIKQEDTGGVERGIAIPGYKSITIDAGTKDVKVNFQNPEGNPCYFEISLLLDDGTVLYKSKMIEPGKGLYEITLNQPLKAGEYGAVVKYETYSLEGLFPMNGAEVKIQLIAQERK